MDSRLGSLHRADPDPRGALRLLAAQALGPQPAEDLTQAFASFGTGSSSARPPGVAAFGFGLGSGPTGPRPDWASSLPTGGVRSTPVSPRHSPPPPAVRTSGFTQVLGFDVAPPVPRGAPGVRRNTSSSGAAFTFSSTPASPSGAANRGRAPTAAASPAGPADAAGDFAGFAVPSFLSSRTPPLGGPPFRRSRFGSDDNGAPSLPALPLRPTTTGGGGARFGPVTASVSAPTSAGASTAGDSDDSSSAPVSPFGGGTLSGGGGVIARGPFADAHASPFTAGGGLSGGGADGGASPLRAVTEGLDGADSGGGGADVSSGGGGMAEAMECEPSVAIGVDVSLGLKSAVHCTADGHVSVVGEHGRGNGGVSQALAAAAAEAAGPPTPPEACLALGRRYLAALFEAVSSPTGAVPDHAAAEFRALLAPAVELRAGPDGGGGGPGGGVGARAEPRRGVEAFLEWLHTDATAYDSWRMSLLSAAAPPGGGEVFLWVAEQARNVGPLLGRVPPSNRTSRSLTLHRLVVDPSGRVAQVWARYQLFDEMRSLLLAPHPTSTKPLAQPLAPQSETHPLSSSDQQQAAAAGAWGSAGSEGAAAAATAALGLGGGTGAAAAGEGQWPPARAPDLSALPCVQRLMAGLAAAAEGGGGGGAGIGGGVGSGVPQGEGALAQAQAAFAVLAASPTPIRAAAAAPADPTAHAAAPAAAAAGSADAPWPPVLRGGATSPSPSRASPGLGLGLGEGGLVADFEAQAGRSVATWLGLVDSSYSGVRDVYGCTAEGLQLWEALGMWRHLGPARGREQVLEQTQRLHAEYDIRIRRGTWAVDRTGRVAYCAWEASARPRLPSPDSGSGSGSIEAGAAGGGEGSGSMLDPGAWLTAGVAVGDVVSGGGGGAGGVSGGGGDVLSGGTGAGVVLSPPPPRAVEWEAGPEAAEAAGVLGHPVEWTSVDVLGLSPLGHVEEVIMYRTPLPGEAEGVFRGGEEVDGEMAPQGPAA
ncbi:hypothetical protein HYH03_004978 [Edaphochlamys debaryana]|uniref:Uncharacterized protein n=1 Tax=Edaphochlamys debaryana TaxID=47281 RepID=A0A835Y8I9_9CHLO|nr:hypothetical protein HYH03_004978 [Edaphochlamys debaryana]|eukprot:KAG2496972.1 hypothetical protein HYH03_004978 [Edaphochlamys debaryana]